MNDIAIGNYVTIGGSDLTGKVLKFEAKGVIAILESGLTGRRRRELARDLKRFRGRHAA